MLVRLCAQREAEEDEQFYRDTETIAFPKIDDRQLALLEPLGKRRQLRRGEMVFKAGQRDLPLTVILQRRDRGFRKARGDGANPRHAG